MRIWGIGMLLNQRQMQMLEALKKEERLSVKALAQRFWVSEMTVRRDLKLLEGEGYIQRYSGGALIKSNEGALPVKYRKLLHTRQKATLAGKAKKHLHDSMSVFIDTSSTCMYLIPLLAEYRAIHVISNSVQTVMAAAERGLACTLIGGDYDSHDMCTVGSLSEHFLRGIHPDIAFFSSAGLSDDGLITDDNEQQTAARKVIMENCRRNIFLFESHKLHKTYLYTVCRAEELADLIIL